MRAVGQITYRLRDGRIRHAGIARGRNNVEILYDGRSHDSVGSWLREVTSHANSEDEDEDSDSEETGEFI